MYLNPIPILPTERPAATYTSRFHPKRDWNAVPRALRGPDIPLNTQASSTLSINRDNEHVKCQVSHQLQQALTSLTERQVPNPTQYYLPAMPPQEGHVGGALRARCGHPRGQLQGCSC